jgi:L-ribulose-5-phosphate 4-epimerase
MSESASPAELRRSLSLACRVLAQQGLVDWVGNLSARIPGSDLAVVSPRGHAIGGLHSFTADDMLVIDLDGQRLEGRHPVPNEVFIHTEVLRARPGVQAVVHTHQAYCVAFSLAGRPLRAAYMVGSELFERPIPVYDDPNFINSPEKGRRLAATLSEAPAVLLRGHGVVTTGLSIEQAALNAIYLEQQALYSYRALQLGGLTLMSEAEIKQQITDLGLAATTAVPAGPWRYYTSLLAPEP